jgi:hypothetical protein
MQNIIKVTAFSVVTMCILCHSVIAASRLDVKLGTGVGTVISTPSKTGDGFLFQPTANMLQIGYSINNRFRVSLEGQFWWYWIMGIASVNCSYFIDIENVPYVRPFVLLGIGYGLASFWNYDFYKNSDEGNDDVSGNFQMLTGMGVDFSVLKWLDLGCELRLRIGFPHNPDVVSLGLFGTATFRFPLSIKLHKRE